jgi:photosystem II stability/assembly factor-like uncharacterized protein
MSASGKYQYFVIYNSKLLRSSDYGVTWSETTFAKTVRGIATSANGEYVSIIADYIWKSSDYGVTLKSDGSISTNYYVMCMSASGQYRLVSNNSSIYGSSDYGSTWSLRGTLTSQPNAASISVSGQYQIAVTNGNIYYSSNYGNTFSTLSTNSFSTYTVNAVSMSSSGQYITVGASYNSISTSIWNCQNSIENGIVSIGTYSTTEIQSASGLTGSIYYDETDEIIKYSNGTSWISLVSAEEALMTGDIFTNHSIDLANFSQHWIQNTSATITKNNFKHISISVSASGKYQIASTLDSSTQSSNSPVYISSDYGQTWSSNSTITSSGSTYANYDVNSTSISATGQYQAVFDFANKNLWISSDFGVNFVNRYTSTSSVSYHCMSSSGKYQYFVIYNSKLLRSSDYGVTWSETTFAKAVRGIATSANGSYVSILSDPIWKSSDYGITFTSDGSIANSYYVIRISASGQYRLVSNGSSIYGSYDYGSTWSLRGNLNSYAYAASISASGQYQIAVTHNYIYYSSNYGNTFSTLSTNSFSIYTVNAVSMSSSGQYITLGASYSTTSTSIWTCQNSIANGIVNLGKYASSVIQSASGLTGAIYYDTSDNIVKYSNGTNWLGISESVQVLSGSSTLSVTSGSTIAITGNSNFTITLSNTSLPYNGQTFYFRKTFTSGTNPTITFSWSNMTVVDQSNTTLTSGSNLFALASTAAIELKLLYVSSTWFICST